jgi:hypothetical protein
MRYLILGLFSIVALQGCAGSDAGSQSSVAIQTSGTDDPGYYIGGDDEGGYGYGYRHDSFGHDGGHGGHGGR